MEEVIRHPPITSVCLGSSDVLDDESPEVGMAMYSSTSHFRDINAERHIILV